MRTKTIILDHPIILRGGPVSELTMPEPTIAIEEDALTMVTGLGRTQNPLTSEMCMFSLLVEVPYDVIRTMRSGDYQKLRDAYAALTRPKLPLAPPVADGTPPKNSSPSDEA